MAGKKEETTYIGNAVVGPLWGMRCRHPVDGNSGQNPTRRAGATARQERFNGKEQDRTGGEQESKIFSHQLYAGRLLK